MCSYNVQHLDSTRVKRGFLPGPQDLSTKDGCPLNTMSTKGRVDCSYLGSENFDSYTKSGRSLGVLFKFSSLKSPS